MPSILTSRTRSGAISSSLVAFSISAKQRYTGLERAARVADIEGCGRSFFRFQLIERIEPREPGSLDLVDERSGRKEATAQRSADRPVTGPVQRREAGAELGAEFIVEVHASAACQSKIRRCLVLQLRKQAGHVVAIFERRKGSGTEGVGLEGEAADPACGTVRTRSRSFGEQVLVPIVFYQRAEPVEMILPHGGRAKVQDRGFA